MYKLLKPFIFLLDPEKAHHLTISMLRLLRNIPIIGSLVIKNWQYENPKLYRNYMGLDFPNPVGLAAGFDKDGKYFEDMSDLGFGFIEIGTVTPVGQDGNPKQRLFRLIEDRGIINRMGFNNEGVEAMVHRLKNRKNKNILIGGNIGKNKVTPNAEAAQDYLKCFEALHTLVDYFVVNVSSPNTPNLRDLQDKEPLTALLHLLQEKNNTYPARKPILLKIAPDLTDEQLDDILDIVKDTDIEGVISTNTTISREGLKTSDARIKEIGNGGLSGAPLKDRATEVIRYLSVRMHPDKIIIGVGGICSAADALEKLEAGAHLIQVYSGLVYAGPTLIKDINKAIAAKFTQHKTASTL